jgi:hypothetical protein
LIVLTLQRLFLAGVRFLVGRVIARVAKEEEGFWMAGHDHVVVDVEGLAKSKDGGIAEKPSAEGVSASAASAASPSAVVDLVDEEEGGGGEEEPLIQAAECRICQEEDSVKNLEKPCACSGSLKVWILSPALASLYCVPFISL